MFPEIVSCTLFRDVIADTISQTKTCNHWLLMFSKIVDAQNKPRFLIIDKLQNLFSKPLL